MEISQVIDRIESGVLVLPMFQRGYVWNRPQVKNLFRSLYLGYPVGGLLIWETEAGSTDVRAGQAVGSGTINLLLDGQQRATSLYGVIKGDSPMFFEGDANAFKDLYFHLDHEEFEFRSPVKMALDSRWVSVTELFEPRAISRKMRELENSGAYTEDQLEYYRDRAQKIVNIPRIVIPDETLTAKEIDTDTAVEIFNEVNSGGKKLTKGDLALARIGAQWPEVREEMRRRLEKWEANRFKADRDWLLRCITAIAANNSQYEELRGKSISDIQQALELAEPAIDRLLEATQTYLGMDDNKAHKSKQAFPPMVKYLVNNNGDFPDDAAKARLLHWYITASIWGRFSGPVETLINQDLTALRSDDPIAVLRQNFIKDQGDRRVSPENFDFNRSSARFYSLLHILSHAGGAKDWGTGQLLTEQAQDSSSALELHHIFPKSYLRNNGISPNDANQCGNLAFQTRNTNRGIRDRNPADYMPEIAEHHPGVLESQWVPNNPELWKVENYHEFLKERRRLLAEAANAFLGVLSAGNLPSAVSATVYGELDDDEEEKTLDDLNRFVTEHGLPAGELGYEIVDPNTAEATVLDLAWPNGLQDGLSEKVAVLINEENSVRIAANKAGFGKVFTGRDEFREYVRKDILGEEEEEEGDAPA